tara:strand:- start:3574 stop:4371 length:798 start_codon:yes stop_codon:yes gene_type:complete
MSATILSVDIGNSRTHWGRYEDGILVRNGNLSSREPTLNFNEILGLGENDRPVDGVVACSVVPHVSTKLQDAATSAGIPCEFLTHERVGHLRINYQNPTEIGPDRLANSLGGFLHAEPPFIVIDMGTAVTLDAVTAANGYEGGAIAPGFALLSEYLIEKTALLPPLDLTRIHRRTGIGRSTTEAMEVGCTKGFAGMIRELVATTCEEIQDIDGLEPSVLVTGGSFNWVKESWIGNLPFYPHLTLEGVLSRAPDLLADAGIGRPNS